MTAPSLRDRIARALHDEGAYCGNCGYEDAFDQHGCLDCQQTLYGYADAVLAALADADPSGAELPEVLDLLRAVVERCVPAVLDAQDRPIDDLWGRVWRRLGTAHPRTKEAHTVDVGHVHVLAEPGGSCAPGCPHPDHRTKETSDG